MIPILLLFHAYIGLRLLAPFGAGAIVAGVAGLALLFYGLPKGFRSKRRKTAAGAMLPWLAVGAFSWLFVLTVLRDVTLAGVALFADAATHEAYAHASALAVMIAVPIVTAVGYFLARRVAPVVEVEVRLAGLPRALHGFTIAQISDVHVGPTIRRSFVERIVESVNRLQADMVAITGDLVDGTVRELSSHTEPIGRLESRHGTYVVTGNHEYYSGAHAWIAELERLGTRVLMNEHVVIHHDGERVAVAGVTDFSAHHFDPSHRSDPHAALRGAPEGAVRLLLAHQPRSAHEAEQAGAHLQLSGHTHGGQFWPWNHFVRLQQPFTAGLRKLGAMWIYVSRGTGYWGPPMRFFGSPSEITRITLVPER